MKTYRGKRLEPSTIGDVLVTVGNGKIIRPLDPSPSQKVCNHSPDGFNWGYGGSGPAQLALAIMLDHFNGDTARAVRLYQKFKWAVIAKLPVDNPWELNSQQIDSVVSQIDTEEMQA